VAGGRGRHRCSVRDREPAAPPTVDAVLTDDVPLRYGKVDGAPGSTQPPTAQSGAAAFSGMAKDAILVP
jgi:hypothetical protein